MAKEVIVLDGDDGRPLPPGKPMTSEERAQMERAADLHWAFQLGEEAAAGDAEACEIKLLEVCADDVEAHAEFERGLQYVAARATKQ